jgi:phosphoglycerol transferase MdoB-like AlkP superfamily enzyme
VLQRLIVLVGHSERFATVGAGGVLRAFATGLRFDLVSLGQFAVPLVLLMSAAPTAWLSRQWFRRGISGLAATLLAVVTFALVADFYFFREFDERLNHKALMYLDQPYTYRVIWRSYPVVPALLVTLLVLAGAAWGFGRLTFRKSVTDFNAVGRGAWAATQIALLILIIRGSVGPKALNTGPAYFSNSPTLAQLTLNPLYTLREAAFSMTLRAEDLAARLPLLPEDDALRRAAELIVRPDDKPLGDADNPLRRVTDSERPQQNYNVVLVVLESLSWQYIGALGGDARLTPNLNKLIENGVSMDRCFAVGDRTTRGFSGIVSAYPDLPGRSVTTRIEATNNFLTIGNVLEDRGYQTMFVYAGQPMYDHRQSFLRSNGYNKLVFENEFNTRTFRTDLGWCDEDLFTEAIDQCNAAGDKPFLATLLTLSFHRPFEIPPGRITPITDKRKKFVDQLNAVHYTDWAIGQFMERAKKAKWFENTLFVFVADHTGGFLEHPLNVASNRVPFLLYGPKIVGQPRRVNAVCSQTDVIPTILSFLGGSYAHTFFGSSVLDRPPESGGALMLLNEQLSYVAGDGAVVTVPFNGQPQLFDHRMPGKLVPVEALTDALRARRDALARDAVALLQTANILFERGAYTARPLPRSAPASP